MYAREFIAMSIGAVLALCGGVAFAGEPDKKCGHERICAAYDETAAGKVAMRCGIGYECGCKKTGAECGDKMLGGKKYWYDCTCRKKATCRKEVCAVYDVTATGKAAAECKRTDCQCEKTDRKCDTNWRGKDKYIFDCKCD